MNANVTVDARFFLPRSGFLLDVEFQLSGSGVTVIQGPSGSGKTTLLRCIGGELCGLQPDTGTVKWAENAEVAYMPQDHGDRFENPVTVFDWMRARGKPRDDDQWIRATLGRLLFSRDEVETGITGLDVVDDLGTDLRQQNGAVRAWEFG